MTDRELLQAAAKAVGFEFNGVWFDERTGLLVWEPPTNYESRDWNPLTDDGDALRLAVNLGIGVRPHSATHWQKPNTTVALFDLPDDRAGRVDIPHGNDPHAATRRAIVRAAAAMAVG